MKHRSPYSKVIIMFKRHEYLKYIYTIIWADEFSNGCVYLFCHFWKIHSTIFHEEHSFDTLPQMHRDSLFIRFFSLKKDDIHEQSSYLKRASGNPLHKVLTKMSKSPREIEFQQYFSLIKDDDNFKIKFPDKVGLV